MTPENYSEAKKYKRNKLRLIVFRETSFKGNTTLRKLTEAPSAFNGFDEIFKLKVKKQVSEKLRFGRSIHMLRLTD